MNPKIYPPDSTPSYMPVPDEITRAAITVATWAKANGFEGWEIGPVAERAMVARLRERVREAELESQEKSMQIGSLMKEVEALKILKESLEQRPRFRPDDNIVELLRKCQDGEASVGYVSKEIEEYLEKEMDILCKAINALSEELDTSKKFYRVAIAERDHERFVNDENKKEIDTLKDRIQLLVRENETWKSSCDYAFPTMQFYEDIVGFKVNDVFETAWNLARATNRDIGIRRS